MSSGELSTFWRPKTKPPLRYRKSYGAISEYTTVPALFNGGFRRRSRTETEMLPAVSNLGRLVTAISASNLVGGHFEKKQPEEDLFIQRFSTRNVQSTNLGQQPKTQIQSKPKTVKDRIVNFLKKQVFPPDANILFYWLALLSLMVVLNWWMLIIREAFHDIEINYWTRWILIDMLTDLLFFFDILVQFRTSYLEQGLVVRKMSKLAKRYVKSRNFWLDIISLFPLDYAIRLISPLNFHPLIYRSPRLIKTYRMMSFYYTLETRTIYPNFTRVANLTHILILSCHWFACFHYMIAESMEFATIRWFNEQWDADNIINQSSTRRYILSLYWATLTLTTIGNTSYPQTDWEYFFTIVSYLIGVFFFATIVGQVGNVITNRNASRQDFERMLDGSKQYMRNHNVPKSMQRRVRRWYDYSWSRGRMTGGSDIESLAVLPDKLKTELALHVNLSTLKKVHMFEECQPEFLHDLVLKMRAIIFTPGDIICRKGEVAREMYIIADGCLEVLDEDGHLIREMRSGDFFGEIGILNLDGVSNRRTADVRSIGYSELFSLSREDVLAAMKDYPDAREILSEYGRRRLKTARPKSSTTPTSPAPSFTLGPSSSDQRPPEGERTFSAASSEPNFVDHEEKVDWQKEASQEKAAENRKNEADNRKLDAEIEKAAENRRVAVPSPITNLLGVRISDEPQNVKHRHFEPIEHRDIKRSVTLDTFKFGRERLLKGCDTELRKIQERLNSMVCGKLKQDLAQEIASIKSIYNQFRDELKKQDETIKSQREEVQRLKYLLYTPLPRISITDSEGTSEKSHDDTLQPTVV